MRANGRRPDQLRPVGIETGIQKFREGSVLVSFGDTRVVCAATIEDRVPQWLIGQQSGWLTAEYAMLPGSTLTRSPRERTGPSGRSHEIQRLVGRSLRAVVDLRAFPGRTIAVDCDVLQADGGTRTAAVTGACVAVELALRHMVKSGLTGAMPMHGRVAAVSAGMLAGDLLLDLDYDEDANAEVDLNVVMTSRGGIVEVQGTAERNPFSKESLDAMLELARLGIAELLRAQEQALKG
jgi:ribonuclease PH